MILQMKKRKLCSVRRCLSLSFHFECVLVDRQILISKIPPIPILHYPIPRQIQILILFSDFHPLSPDLPYMADPPMSPAAASHESGGEQSPNTGGVREQDRYLPIANISRIMKKVLPANGKIAKDAKDTVQECVSEFISFVTSEASDKCQKEKRKTINGDDLLWAMATLGFEDYIDPLKSYLTRYRELECDAKGSSRGGDESAKRDAVGTLPGQNSQQYMQPGALTYINTQFEEPGYPKDYDYKSSTWRQ